MNWIDDDLAERIRREYLEAQQAEINHTIAAHTEEIYNQLWNEVVERIAEVKAKPSQLPQLFTNGGPFLRKIIRPVNPKRHEQSRKPIEVELKIAPDKLSITAKSSESLPGSEYPILFSLAQGEDDVIRMKHKGEHYSVHEAAKLILRPLLFPELFVQR
jgi:hypothetical protein